MSIIELRVVRSQLARPAFFSPYSSKLFTNDSLLFQCASASFSDGIAAVWYVCTAMVVCRRIGLVEEDDGDVEIVEVRKARRKERSKMKRRGLRPVQGCQAQQDLVPTPPHSTKGAQQGSVGLSKR